MYSIFAIYLHTYLAVFVLVISVSWIQHSRRGCYGNMYMSQFFFIGISVHRIWILLFRCQLSFRTPLSMLSRAVQFQSTVWPMLQVNGDPISRPLLPFILVKQFFLLFLWMAINIFGQQSGTANRRMEVEYQEKQLWVLVMPGLLSLFCGNQHYLQMTQREIF